MVCLTAGLLSACAPVGPDYLAPTMALPAGYADGGASSLGPAASQVWWEGLADPVLSGLMARGLAQNLTVRAAHERVREAEAMAAANGRDAAYGGDAELGLTNVWTEDGFGPSDEQARANVGFNLDLFGLRARAREQSAAHLQSAIYQVGAAKLAYQEALVTAYLNARYHQAALGMAEQSVARQRRMVEAIDGQSSLGGTTQVIVRRERGELADRMAELPAMRATYRVSAQQIATLVGLSGQEVLDGLASGSGLPRPPGGIEAGVPIDLLRNRPDILASERELAAATAAIGVAQAQLYPALSISGNITLDPGAAVALGPRLTIPVLSIPGQRALTDAARARTAQAELDWRETVLKAVENVETQLALTAARRDEIGARQSALDQYRMALRLVNEGHSLGANTPMDVIRAETDAAGAAERLLRAQHDHALAWARLNLATGRGWQIGAPAN